MFPKRPAFLIFTVIILSSIQLRAQILPDADTTIKLTYHFGVKAGANFFQIKGSDFASGLQTGFDAGFFGEIGFTQQWGIQPEILYSQAHYQTGGNFSSNPNGVNNYKGQLNYLSIPILLTYTPVKRLSVQAGPQISALLNNDKGALSNVQAPFKNGDFSLVFGLQGNEKRLKYGVRYVVGLTNLNNLGRSYTYDLATWTKAGFQVYAGFRIF